MGHAIDIINVSIQSISIWERRKLGKTWNTNRKHNQNESEYIELELWRRRKIIKINNKRTRESKCGNRWIMSRFFGMSKQVEKRKYFLSNRLKFLIKKNDSILSRLGVLLSLICESSIMSHFFDESWLGIRFERENKSKWKKFHVLI